MNNTRRNKMLAFMLVGSVGLASLRVAGNALTIETNRSSLSEITLKQLNLGTSQEVSKWAMDRHALRVTNDQSSTRNSVVQGANQVGGQRNTVNVPSNASLGSVIVAGQGNTVESNAQLGAIVASNEAQLNQSNASVILATHSGSLQGQNSAIVASKNVTVNGSGSAVIAGESSFIRANKEGSLAIGNRVQIDYNGVFAFNGKANGNLTSEKDHTFIVNVDNGFLIGKNAPEADASRVPLQVKGAIKVGASDKSNAIVLKGKNGNQCLCVNNMSLSSLPVCKQVCGEGGSSEPAPTYSCTGTPFANATLIPGDNQGLTANTQIRLVSVNTNAKCEYQCNAGYQLNTSKTACVQNLAPTYSCTGTPFANATLIPGDNQGLTANTQIRLVSANTNAKCEYQCNAGYVLNNGACVRERKPGSCSVGYEWDDVNSRCVVSEYEICGISSFGITTLSISSPSNSFNFSASPYNINDVYDGYCLRVPRRNLRHGAPVMINGEIQFFEGAGSSGVPRYKSVSCGNITINDQTKRYTHPCNSPEPANSISDGIPLSTVGSISELEPSSKQDSRECLSKLRGPGVSYSDRYGNCPSGMSLQRGYCCKKGEVPYGGACVSRADYMRCMEGEVLPPAEPFERI